MAIWFLLEHTATGRRLYATGFNADAARLQGVRTDRLRFLTLVTSALLSGAAGVVFASSVGSGSPTAGTPYLLSAYAAAFVGAWASIAGAEPGTAPNADPGPSEAPRARLQRVVELRSALQELLEAVNRDEAEAKPSTEGDAKGRKKAQTSPLDARPTRSVTPPTLDAAGLDALLEQALAES